MNSFETGVCVGYLLNNGTTAKLTHIDVSAPENTTDYVRYDPPSNFDGFEYFRVKGIKDKVDEIAQLQQELEDTEEELEECHEACTEVAISIGLPIPVEDPWEVVEGVQDVVDEDTALGILFPKIPISSVTDVDIPSNAAFSIGDLFIVFLEEWVDFTSYREKQLIPYAVLDGHKYKYTNIGFLTTIVNRNGTRLFNIEIDNVSISFSNASYPGALVISFNQINTNISTGTITTRSNFVAWTTITYDMLGYSSAAAATADMATKSGNAYTQA